MSRDTPPDSSSRKLRPHEVSYPTLSRDTDPKAEAVQLEIYRQMPAWRKIELVGDAIETSRILALSGLQSRYPEAGEEEIRRRFMDLMLGEELAAKVYGPPPYAARSRVDS